MKWFLLLLVASGLVHAQQVQLIDWFAGADIVATGDSAGGEEIRDGAVVREFEFSANSQIDHTWEGVLTLAYHNELQLQDEAVDVHEAFLFSPKIFDGTTVKLGKFFLGFGRLNRFHRHDWIFTEAPVYHKDFFGNEGVIDTGAEISSITGGDMRTTIGIVSGSDFVHGHAHEEGEDAGHDHASEGQPYTPTGYIRIASFKEITTQKGFETALNFIARNDSEGTRFHYAGLDFIYKNRVAQYVQDLVQAEVWNRATFEKSEQDSIDEGGGYLYYQRGFNRHHALGLRYDFYNLELHKDEGETHREVDGLHLVGDYSAYTLSYIYTNSEFMKTRLTLEHSNGLEIDEEKDQVTRFYAQLVFSIGAHPAHVY